MEKHVKNLSESLNSIVNESNKNLKDLFEKPLMGLDALGFDDEKTGKNKGKSKPKRFRSDDEGETLKRDDDARGPKFKDSKKSKGNSFKKQVDRRISQADGFVKKLHKKLGRTELPFNIVLINSKEGRDYSEVGQVTPEWIEDNLGIEGFVPEEDNINIFYTNNSGSEQVKLTPWILMHRFGHAIAAGGRSGKETTDAYQFKEFRINFLENIARLAEEFYGMRMNVDKRNGWVDPDDTKKWNALMHAILTMKSARDKKINRPNEAFYELLAQSVLGKNGIKFNKLPEVLKVGRERYRLKDQEEANYAIERMEDEVGYHIDGALGTTYGNTYVM